ncbi:hypothetical protein RvY_04396 [Ramazzottius varieornatus]|uniref:Uncharacterized protein n=1 Tax=Ramazzottius varieornatus TaxID=947166 RepID=A0A1D1V1H3_RAMVA|nr:hypothetical protein RvY_04396 [Ramazzottius varieornatus]
MNTNGSRQVATSSQTHKFTYALLTKKGFGCTKTSLTAYVTLGVQKNVAEKATDVKTRKLFEKMGFRRLERLGSAWLEYLGGGSPAGWSW